MERVKIRTRMKEKISSKNQYFLKTLGALKLIQFISKQLFKQRLQ